MARAKPLLHLSAHRMPLLLAPGWAPQGQEPAAADARPLLQSTESDRTAGCAHSQRGPGSTGSCGASQDSVLDATPGLEVQPQGTGDLGQLWDPGPLSLTTELPAALCPSGEEERPPGPRRWMELDCPEAPLQRLCPC